MTQPVEAVGGATNDPVIAAEPTIEDRFASFVSDEPKEDEPQGEDPHTVVAEDAPEEASAEEAPEEPAVAPPTSWSDEDKAIFGQLPPDAQKVIARRESERDKFLQTKSQEVRQVAQQAQQLAVTELGKLNATYAQQLAALVPHVPEEPSAHLLATDPQAYAYMLEAHKQASAQRNAIVGQLQGIAQQQAMLDQQMTAQQQQAVREHLAETFPEFLDPTQGPDLQKTLGATAQALGYSQEQIAAADARDILAMKQAHEWRTKADKYDAMMAKQMEGVRAAKTLPSVSRPGAAQPRGAAANQRYTEDRKAMRSGDKDATARVFSRFI
ncbi:MAG: hypothetical protein RIR00_2630 [Pseudomonadota bacterium]